MALPLLLLALAAPAAHEIWVHPSDGPSSLHAALDAAASTPTPTTIHVEGRHTLTRPLRLDARHSGTRFVGHGAATISGAATIGGTPGRDGAKNVSGWTVHGPAKCTGCSEVWMAKVPAGADSRQFYVNGVRANRTWVAFPIGSTKEPKASTIHVPGTLMQARPLTFPTPPLALPLTDPKLRCMAGVEAQPERDRARLPRRRLRRLAVAGVPLPRRIHRKRQHRSRKRRRQRRRAGCADLRRRLLRGPALPRVLRAQGALHVRGQWRAAQQDRGVRRPSGLCRLPEVAAHLRRLYGHMSDLALTLLRVSLTRKALPADRRLQPQVGHVRCGRAGRQRLDGRNRRRPVRLEWQHQDPILAAVSP